MYIAELILPFISVHLEPFARISILFVSGFLLYNESINIGQLVAIVAYFTLLTNDMNKISELIDGYTRAQESALNIKKLFLRKDSHKQSATSSSSDTFIELKNFSFKIKQQQYSLRTTNCVLKKGYIYALTGENGLGKSLFVKIITSRFHDYSGSVYVDGKNIAYNTSSIQHITQSDLLIQDYSVLDNIVLRVQNIDREYFNKIIQDLQIEYLIDRMHPAQFSGGEKRKIILARFLYHLNNATYFILDESFVSLDHNYTKYLLPLMKEYLKNKTGIIISHNSKIIKALCNNYTLDELFAN